ncbi:hypothetical protein NPIL_197011 [Nephila pilipes]|uniref:Uncharacterized protein n=1 Tax=Nephila pilipes TaxID=299642 RepID=A0A8X6TZH6_NEPPI|nr:hypothetical protein NPIL_197011 [Nephila pilipes]
MKRHEIGNAGENKNPILKFIDTEYFLTQNAAFGAIPYSNANSMSDVRLSTVTLNKKGAVIPELYHPAIDTKRHEKSFAANKRRIFNKISKGFVSFVAMGLSNVRVRTQRVWRVPGER